MKEERKMTQISQYKTITAHSFEDLDRKVNESINQGFQPFGDPYVTDVGEFLACQAVVRGPRGVPLDFGDTTPSLSS
jgi:hypothetical protein